MTITINEQDRSFTFKTDGEEQTIAFSEILASEEWKNSRNIRIVHQAVNQYGNHPVTVLNRVAFTDNMLHGDEEYMKWRGAWDLNTAIHKLYALLDGATLQEAEQEIANICQQRKLLDEQKMALSHEKVKRIAAIEKQIEEAKTNEEIAEKQQLMLEVKAEEVPILVSREMKRMFIAARDTEKPAITLKNVTPDLVKQEYEGKGKKLTVI